MSFPFNAKRGLIIVQTELFGSSGSIVLRLALDTGATVTMVNSGLLTAIGCDPGLSPTRFQVTTSSGVEYVPRIPVDRIQALGRELAGFPIVAHTLPPSARVDGLLGLDFLRGGELTIDFQTGSIVLT